jgi:virulence factor
MCVEFLGAIRDGRRLDATDALATHEICESVVRAAEVSDGARNVPAPNVA